MGWPNQHQPVYARYRDPARAHLDGSIASPCQGQAAPTRLLELTLIRPVRGRHRREAGTPAACAAVANRPRTARGPAAKETRDVDVYSLAWR